jgi:hypothetical protein
MEAHERSKLSGKQKSMDNFHGKHRALNFKIGTFAFYFC